MIFNIMGNGFVLQNGNEKKNVFNNNLAVFVKPGRNSGIDITPGNLSFKSYYYRVSREYIFIYLFSCILGS